MQWVSQWSFLVTGAGSVGHPRGSLPQITNKKVNSIWVIDLNVKVEIIKSSRR